MSDRSRSYLVLACSMAVALGLGLHAVAPGLPLVQQVFGIDDFEVGLITSAYVLPGVLFAAPLGVVADLLGRRRVFSVAGLLYGGMGIAMSMAPTFEWLLTWRLCQGVAFAALMPLTVTIIGDAYTGLAQVRAQAQRQVSMAMANLAVPIVGAQLAAVAWSLPFAIQSLTILPALFALVVLDPGSSVVERRSGYLRLAMVSLRRRGFPSVLNLGFLRFFARFSIIAYLPLQLTRQLGTSLTAVGVVMATATGLGFASAMVTARLSARLTPSRLVLGALIAVGLALIAFAFPINLAVVLAIATVFALSDGLISVLQSSYAARGTPDGVRAGLVAVNGTARNAGKFVGPLVTGAIASLAGIGPALALAGLIVIVSALLLPRGLSALDHLLRDSAAAVETT